MNSYNGREGTPLFIKRLSAEHIEQVAAIEKANFSEPWSENSLRLLCSGEYPSFVICSETGEVFGYVGTARVLDELQILNAAVRADKRRLGYGRALMLAVDGYAKENGIISSSLEVRASNIAAISLYESCGYKKTGIRKGFYRYPAEDAAIMVKSF